MRVDESGQSEWGSGEKGGEEKQMEGGSKGVQIHECVCVYV